MATKENVTNKKSVKGTSKADAIYNYGDKVTINAGSGNDTIENYGDKVTATSGAGDDSIYNEGTNVLFKYDGGNDLIQGFNAASTLKIASGKLNTVLATDGFSYFLTVGENVITLEGGAKVDELKIVDAKGKAIKYKVNKKIVGTKSADNFTNYLDSAKISGGAGNDDIRNYGAKVSISGGAGNDSIRVEQGDNVTIDAGAGNDWIFNSGAKASINTGAGNDVINTYGNSVTVDAGEGNDLVYNEGKKVLFKFSGGNDTIRGFDSTSTLQIASGTFNSVVTSDGENYFVTVGRNTIKLDTSSGSYYDEDGNYYSPSHKHLDKLNIVDAKGKALSFQVKARVIGTRVKDYLYNYVDNAIVLADAGNDFISNYASNVSIDAGAGNDEIYIGSDSKWNNETKTYDQTYSENVTVNAGAGNDFISNNGTNVKIYGDAGNDSINNYGANVSIYGGAGNDTIYSGDDNVSIYGGVGDDLISLSSYSDNNLVVYKTGDGNDIVEGFGVDDSIKIIGTSKFSATVSENDVILNIGTGTLTLKDAVEKKITFLNSKNELLAENIYMNAVPSVTLKASDKSFDMGAYTTYVDASKTSAGVQIYSSSSRYDDVTILGGTGNDSIYSSGDNVSIYGGEGSDSISLSSYSDNNLVVYKTGDGNDIVEGFGVDDSIKIIGTSKLSASVSENDVILNIGTGTLTLKDAVEKKITFLNSKDKLLAENVYMKDGSVAVPSVTLKASDTSFDMGAYTTYVDASKTSAGVQIYSSSSRYDDVTILGGAGNDTLTGGSGNDVFIYKPNEGTDTITDYSYYSYGGDMLQILKADGTEGGTFTDSSFSDNKLTLTIDGGGKVIFNNASASGTFNINGTTYKISDSKLVSSN